MAITRKKKTSNKRRETPETSEVRTPASAGLRRAEPATTAAPQAGGTKPVAEEAPAKKSAPRRTKAAASSESTASTAKKKTTKVVAKAGVIDVPSSKEPIQTRVVKSPVVVSPEMHATTTKAPRPVTPDVATPVAEVVTPAAEAPAPTVSVTPGLSAEARHTWIAEAAYYLAERRG